MHFHALLNWKHFSFWTRTTNAAKLKEQNHLIISKFVNLQKYEQWLEKKTFPSDKVDRQFNPQFLLSVNFPYFPFLLLYLFVCCFGFHLLVLLLWVFGCFVLIWLASIVKLHEKEKGQKKKKDIRRDNYMQ